MYKWSTLLTAACIWILFSQLILEANLRGEFRNTIVGMDDVFIANGSCCPVINTPEDSAKGIYFRIDLLFCYVFFLLFDVQTNNLFFFSSTRISKHQTWRKTAPTSYTCIRGNSSSTNNAQNIFVRYHHRSSRFRLWRVAMWKPVQKGGGILWDFVIWIFQWQETLPYLLPAFFGNC